MPIVAIEIAPPVDPPPELSRALVESCAAAVRNGDCVLVGREGVSPTAVAIVRWDADELHVRVELGEKSKDEARWRSRDIHFSDADARVERWRTAGLTIATLAGEIAREESDRAAEPKGTQAPPPLSDTPRASSATSKHRPEDHRASFWADVGGLVGTGVADGPRAGVWADVGARVGGTDVIGLLGFDYATASTPAPLSVQWLAFSAGVGAALGARGKGFAFEPAVAFRLERLHASASEGTRTDSGALFGYGAAAKATVVWQLGLVSPLVGGSGWVNAEPIRILVHDQYVGTESRWGGMVVLGARLRIR